MLAGCQRPVPPQVLQPVPPPLGPMAPVQQAARMAPMTTTAAVAAITSCNLEALAGAPFTAAPAIVYRRAPAPRSGWAMLDKVAPARVQLLAEDAVEPARAWQVELPVNVERDDVAAYFKLPAMRRTGFAAKVDFSALPPGAYRLLLQYGEGAGLRRCDNARQIQLVD
jgi:hypothetical protein